jgi:secreted PhoX family phosphatase
MDGEEVAEGRAFAHGPDGTSWELPRLGKFAWENSVASPNTGNKTVVVGLDDTTPGEVYVYVGDKTSSGSPVDKAGLTNGSLYGVKVTGFPTESVADGIPGGTRFTLGTVGNVENMTGAQLQTASTAAGLTQFNRPEDGAWDTQDPNVFYFVTTASFTTESRLWRLTFDDVTNPAAGGKIEMLVEDSEDGGTGETHHMFDNVTVDSRGRVLLQEDPGGQNYVARIWQYSPDTDTLTEIAHHDPDRFAPGGSSFLTNDEESSGIIDVSSILGEGWFLGDVQAHYAITGELVEGGQLFALHVPPGKFK